MGVNHVARWEVVTSVAPEPEPVAEEIALLQNYPNPFNPNTTITFGLPSASMVRVSVYDMLGSEVRVLVNERREAGIYVVEFGAESLASGTYLCRLVAGGVLQTKKLTLIR